MLGKTNSERTTEHVGWQIFESKTQLVAAKRFAFSAFWSHLQKPPLEAGPAKSRRTYRVAKPICAGSTEILLTFGRDGNDEMKTEW
jgi:hypothetical protein